MAQAFTARPTIKGTIAQVKAFGLTCRHKEGEYRVNLKPEHGGTEDTAFYTHCPDDAVCTAEHWAKSLPKTPQSPEAQIDALTAQVADLKAFAEMVVLKTQRFGEDIDAIFKRHGLDG